jgi:hypothetical protein
MRTRQSTQSKKNNFGGVGLLVRKVAAKVRPDALPDDDKRRVHLLGGWTAVLTCERCRQGRKPNATTRIGSIVEHLQTPSFAYWHESSPSNVVIVERTSWRGPQSEHEVPYAHRAGEKDPGPPSRQNVSPCSTAAQVSWHVLKRSPTGAKNGGGGIGGGLGGGGIGGGLWNVSPVTA